MDTQKDLALRVLCGEVSAEPMGHDEFLNAVARFGLSTAFLQRYLGKSYGTMKKYLYTPTKIPSKPAYRMRLLVAMLNALCDD